MSNVIQDQNNLNTNPQGKLAKSIISDFLSFGEVKDKGVYENIKKINNTDKNLYHIRIEQNHVLTDSYENNLNIINNDLELKNFNSESFKNDTHFTITNYNNVSNIHTTSINNNTNIPSKFISNENEKINNKIIDTKKDSVDSNLKKNNCLRLKNLKKKNNSNINKKYDFPFSKSLETKRAKKKYLIKTERGDKDIFNYLYDTRNATKNFRENFSKEIFSRIHTFKPEISENSVSIGKLRSSNREEIRDNLFKRLAESKRLKNILKIKDLKHISTISSLERDYKLTSKQKRIENFNKNSISDGIITNQKSCEKVIVENENEINIKFTQKKENYEENNNPSNHLIQNKKIHQTIDSYNNIHLKNDLNRNLTENSNYLQNINDIFSKNKLNNQKLISIMKSMNHHDNKFPDSDFNISPQNNKINNSMKTQQESRINKMRENDFKNINYLSQSIQSSNYNPLKLDHNSSCTNSKRNIIYSKRNETQNTNDDILNSNDFKISNSNMYMQQSKHDIKTEDNKYQEVKSIIKYNNQNEIPQSNILNFSSNEIGENFIDKLIDNDDNFNSNLDDYIDIPKNYQLTDNCNLNYNLPFKNPNITENKTLNNTLENNRNLDFNKKGLLPKGISDINYNSNKIYEKRYLNDIFDENKVLFNEEKPIKFYPINSNYIYKQNNLENKILDSVINSDATFIVHKTESVQEEDKLLKENSLKNKFYGDTRNISSSISNFNRNKIQRNRETKNLRELREEEKLYGQLDEFKKEKIKHEKLIQKRCAQNIDKLKINNLKEIFELVINNNKDIEKLKESGVSCFIIEQLIQPVIRILQKRNLEFSFNNFYSLAKEFLNRLF